MQLQLHLRLQLSNLILLSALLSTLLSSTVIAAPVDPIPSPITGGLIQSSQPVPTFSLAPVPAPVPTPSDLFIEKSKLIEKGQTPEEVISVLESAPDYVKHHNKSSVSWYYNSPVTADDHPQSALIIKFTNGRSTTVKRVQAKSNPGQPTRFEKIVGAAATIYMLYECPQLRDKPLLWLTVGDINFLQACAAAGF